MSSGGEGAGEVAKDRFSLRESEGEGEAEGNGEEERSGGGEEAGEERGGHFPLFFFTGFFGFFVCLQGGWIRQLN